MTTPPPVELKRSRDQFKESARIRLREAVRKGQIIKPLSCSKCGDTPSPHKIHGHHHNGYVAWSDVVWLCVRCHFEADKDKWVKTGDSNGMRKHPERSFLVTNNPFQKLNLEKAKQVKSRRAQGETLEAIASSLGVSIQAVWQITTGRTWKKA